jgi:hypothetical protein
MSAQTFSLFGKKEDKKDDSKPAAGGLFGMGGKKEGPDVSKEVADMQGQLADFQRRLIVIEERYSDLRKKLQVTEQNVLSDFKRLHTEVKSSNSEVMDTKHEMDGIKSKMMLIIKELKLLARSEDVDTLKKYLDMWQPLNFVTQNEVEKLIRDSVEQKFEDLNLKVQEEGFIEIKIKESIEKMMQQRAKKK